MPIVFIALTLLGLSIGSFLTVVVGRLPHRASLITPASHCPRCLHPIRNRHNVPVLGWFVLHGRCRDCALPISARYPLIELLTAEVFVLVGVAGIAASHPALTLVRLVGAAALIAVVVIAVDPLAPGWAPPALITVAAAIGVDVLATEPGQLLVVLPAALVTAATAAAARRARAAAPLALAAAGAVHLLAGIPLEQLSAAATLFGVVGLLTLVVASGRFSRSGYPTHATRSAA